MHLGLTVGTLCVATTNQPLLLTASLTIKRKRFFVQTCNPMCRSVCCSVWRGYCDKTADCIWMLFGVVIGFSRGMGVLDGGGDRRREEAVLRVNVGHPIVTNGTLGCSYSLP